MEYIRSLPINDTPEMFGLHDNANITFALNETHSLLSGIVKLQPKSKTGGGRSQEEVRGNIAFNRVSVFLTSQSRPLPLYIHVGGGGVLTGHAKAHPLAPPTGGDHAEISSQV